MEITSNELKNKIDNGENIIVDFWAGFCGPCKIMKPVFEQVAKENNSNVQMFFMDVEKNRDFAISLGVRAVPTIKTFSKGKEVYSKPGVKSENELKQLIQDLING